MAASSDATDIYFGGGQDSNNWISLDYNKNSKKLSVGVKVNGTWSAFKQLAVW